MLKRIATASMLAMLPMGALAAPIASPIIDVPFSTGDFTSSGTWGDFISFNAPATGQGFEITSDLFSQIQLNFDLSDPYSYTSGFFSLTSSNDNELDGVLSGITYGDGTFSITFTDIQGNLSSIFGDELLVKLTFFEAFEGNPLVSLVDGESYDFSYTVEGNLQPATVPLPAGGILLLSGLGLLKLRRRLKVAL